MTIYKKDEGKSYFLNAREVAPLKANSTMYKQYTTTRFAFQRAFGSPSSTDTTLSAASGTRSQTEIR